MIKLRDVSQFYIGPCADGYSQGRSHYCFMATPPRFEKGVGLPKGTGEYFVAEQCIDCDLCRQVAPTIFQRKFTGTGGISYVTRQPSTNFEFKKADEARDACPVGAIQLQESAALAAA